MSYISCSVLSGLVKKDYASLINQVEGRYILLLYSGIICVRLDFFLVCKIVTLPEKLSGPGILFCGKNLTYLFDFFDDF